MNKGDTISGVIVVAFGLLFVVTTLMSPVLTVAAATSDGVPGAGFFPFLLGCITIALGALLTVRGLRQNNKSVSFELNEEGKTNLKVLALVVLGLILFFVFWNLFNQFIIGLLLLNLYFNVIFRRTWKFTLIYSTIFTAFIYLIFVLGFSIQFSV